MHIESNVFVRLKEGDVTQYTLTNDNAMSLSVLTFGARVSRLRLPNRDGHNPNLTIGFITFQDYLHTPGLWGATIGPLAGPNDELPDDSGRTGWQNWNWHATTEEGDDYVSVTLSLTLEDGQDGLPGRRKVAIRHVLDNANHWQVDWHIETDTPVPLRPRLNVPFVLSGDPAKSVMDQRLRLDAEPAELPERQLHTEATVASLIAKDWMLHFVTDAKGLVIDTYPDIDDQCFFEGITGHPHLAIGIQPAMAEFTLMPGAPFKRTTEITLHRLQ